MSASLREPAPKPSASFTSRKLDVQRAVISDKRAPAGAKLMFLYVLHEAWEERGEPHVVGRATIPDQAIMDDVPGHAVDTTVYRSRKRFRDLGYWNYESGKGVRSTVYFIFDQPVDAVLRHLEKTKEIRKRNAGERQASLKAGEETLQSHHLAIKNMRRTAQNAGGGTVENAGANPEGTLQIAQVRGDENAGMSPLSSPLRDSLPDDSCRAIRIREAEADAGMAAVGAVRIAQEKLYELLGGGSQTSGMIVGAKMGNEFYRLAELLAREGLSASEISRLRAKAA